MYSIVITTINIPYVVENLIKNCLKFEHSDVIFIIVGDLKTPEGIIKFVDDLKSKYSYNVIYLDPYYREDWFKDLYEFIPFNSVERRNFGYLHAAACGADIIISADDDNFPLEDVDYIGSHSIINGPEKEIVTVSSRSGWFNICSLMETDPSGISFYHRGFPLSKRWDGSVNAYHDKKVKIGVNAGLWLQDPDIDTFVRAALPFKVTAIETSEIAVEKGINTVFNSQNTAFDVKYLPFFYLITFSSKMKILYGNNSFRYDDIWMSMFCKKALDHLNEHVCFGHPFVCQKRNEHNFILDMNREMMALEMTEKLIRVLDSVTFSGENIIDMYNQLITHFENNVNQFDKIGQSHIINMTYGMRCWLKAVRSL